MISAGFIFTTKCDAGSLLSEPYRYAESIVIANAKYINVPRETAHVTSFNAYYVGLFRVCFDISVITRLSASYYRQTW